MRWRHSYWFIRLWVSSALSVQHQPEREWKRLLASPRVSISVHNNPQEETSNQSSINNLEVLWQITVTHMLCAAAAVVLSVSDISWWLLLSDSSSASGADNLSQPFNICWCSSCEWCQPGTRKTIKRDVLWCQDSLHVWPLFPLANCHFSSCSFDSPSPLFNITVFSSLMPDFLLSPVWIWLYSVRSRVLLNSPNVSCALMGHSRCALGVFRPPLSVLL